MLEKELFRLEGAPVSQNRLFPDAAAARACRRADISLSQDPSSGIIRNRLFDPALRAAPGYVPDGGLSGAFRAHLAAALEVVRRGAGGRPVTEIGCGAGTFLKMMLDAGLRAGGMDPEYCGPEGLADKREFEPGLRLEPGLVVLRHVLEHVPDPAAFLGAVAAACGGEGRVYIEVPDFDWIRRRGSWPDICYEHVSYFRAGDFGRLFSRLSESGSLFGGQYLYVVAPLSALRAPSPGEAEAPLPADFAAAPSRPPGRSALWGCGAKGVMFADLAAKRGAAPDLAVDSDPARRGKFLPGSGLKVEAPEAALAALGAGDTVWVLNPNYLPEIAASTGNRYNYRMAVRNGL